MFSMKKALGVKDEDKSLLYRTYFLYFCSGAMANAMGSVLKDMRNPLYGYGFSAGFQGVLSSVSQFGGLAANLLSGLLPFLIGRKKSTVSLAILPVVAIILMAITGNPYVLVMGFLMVGMGKGVNSNITNIVVNQTATNKGFALNFLHAFFSTGAILGPILMASFLQEKWRIPILIICGGLFVAVILMGTSTLSSEREVKEKTSIGLPKSFRFWYNTAIMFFYLAVESCLLSYTVSYFTYTGIFSDSTSNLLASLLWFAVLIGRLSCASIMHKVKRRYMILVLGIGFITSFFCLMQVNTPVAAMVSLFCVGIFMSGIYPTTMSTQEEKYMKSSFCSGLCIGVCTFATIIMPSVIGSVTNSSGSYRTGLSTLLVPLSLMVAFMVLKVFVERKEN